MSDKEHPYPTDPEQWMAFTQSFGNEQLHISETVRGGASSARSMHLKELLPRASMQVSTTTQTLLSETVAMTSEHTDEDQEALLEPVEFDLGELLAKGGMGRICKARQIPLHRDVVIKMLRLDRRNEEMAHRLLQEACLTGVLEHPNIVPIYQLGKDEDGHPMLVMKRIEGVTWSDVLKAKQESPDTLPPEQRSLEWHIRILMQVCNALEFAHSKKIVHRDLKPENVMIGEFGEVYLLDWGIAVSLDPNETRPLPSIHEARGIVGTPSYMAPEMLAMELVDIDERTDVYLLGSVLHELLTGSAPHVNLNMLELLGQICTRTAFEYNKKVPSELADVCNRAMNLYKENRFQNVRAFRLALEQFLTHTEAYKLVEEGHKLMGELKGHLALVSPEPTTLPAFYVPAEEVNTEIYAVFWRCHFGFKQALRIWEDCKEASDGLQELLELMLEHELDQKDIKAAGTLISELPTPNPELSHRLETLRQKQDKRAKKLTEFQKGQFDRDAEISAKVRRNVAVSAFLILCVSCFIAHFLEVYGYTKTTHYTHLLGEVSGMTFLLLAAGIFRKALFKNRYNRQVLMLFMLVLSGQTILRIIYIYLDFPMHYGTGIDLVVLFCYAGVLAIFVDRLLILVGLSYLLMAFAVFQWPTYTLIFVGLGHAVTVFNMGKLWKFEALPSPLEGAQ